MYKGYVDEATPYMLRGWAVVGDMLQPARVQISVDGLPVALVRCGGYRADLDDAGIRDGFAEFSYAMPEIVRNGEEHLVSVAHEDSDMVIWEGRISFNATTDSAWSFDARSDGQHCITKRSSSRASLTESIKATRKLAILATFRTSQRILSYQKFLALNLRTSGYTVVYVDVPHKVDTPMDYSWIDKSTHLIRRLNYGYDFGSWSAGLAESIDALEFAEEIVLINDSCYALGSTKDFFERLRRLDSDVVGICDSYEHLHHLQSQVLVFRGSAITTGFLQRFFDNYKPSSDKAYTIKFGELGITECARNFGLSVSPLASYDQLSSLWLERVSGYIKSAKSALKVFDKDRLSERFENISEAIVFGQPLNPSHFFWDILIEEFDSPFLKKELVTLNPCGVPTSFLLPRVLEGIDTATMSMISESRSHTPGLRAHALSNNIF